LYVNILFCLETLPKECFEETTKGNFICKLCGQERPSQFDANLRTKSIRPKKSIQTRKSTAPGKCLQAKKSVQAKKLIQPKNSLQSRSFHSLKTRKSISDATLQLKSSG